ncbi:ClC family H(+)/Cl(-) exchange transporter [Pseudothermotoga elfii]
MGGSGYRKNRYFADILSTKKVLTNKLIFKSFLTGAVSGLVVVLYRLSITCAENIRSSIKYGSWFIFWIFMTVGFSLIIWWITKKVPHVNGSGIPQVRAILLRKINYEPLRVLLGKFFGGFLAIINGFSLGREGLSVQIGASVGLIFSNKFAKNDLEKKHMIVAGSSAGLAAAFNAPFAAVIFSIEELQRNISPLTLLTSMIAAITAGYISKVVFGVAPIFDLKLSSVLPLKYYPLILGLGVVIGIFGAFFTKSILWFSEQMGKLKVFSLMIPTIAAWFFLLKIPQVLGGGHELIVDVAHGLFSAKMLIILLVLKFYFTMISYGSKAPGGIFLPMLAIGALIGSAYYHLINVFWNFNDSYLTNFAVLGMASYFASVVRAPITGIALVTELVGSFNHLLSLSVVSISAYIISSLFKVSSVYDMLFERLPLSKTAQAKRTSVIRVTVTPDSELAGLKIKDCVLPESCLIAFIKRDNNEIIPNGETVIHPGDVLTIILNQNDEVPHFLPPGRGVIESNEVLSFIKNE